MLPSPGSIGILLALITISIVILIGLICCTIKNGIVSSCFKALVTSVFCGFVAFVIVIVSHSRFMIFTPFVFGFLMGVIAGAVWFGVCHVFTLIFTRAAFFRKKGVNFLGQNRIWYFGILPSTAYLAYLVSNLSRPYNDVEFWWVKLFGVLIVGLLAAIILNVFKTKVFEKSPEITLKSSPLFWMPVVFVALIMFYKFWIV